MTRLIAVCATVVTMAALSATPALAGDVTIEKPWARASAGMAKAGAAFMTLRNEGATDRLVAASAPVAKVAELHTHIKEGHVMRMRKVEAIEVTGGAVTSLAPGGLHVMLMGLHGPLQEGTSFPLTLTFERAGQMTVDVMVMKAGAMGMDHSKHEPMKMDHK